MLEFEFKLKIYEMEFYADSVRITSHHTNTQKSS